MIEFRNVSSVRVLPPTRRGRAAWCRRWWPWHLWTGWDRTGWRKLENGCIEVQFIRECCRCPAQQEKWETPYLVERG